MPLPVFTRAESYAASKGRYDRMIEQFVDARISRLREDGRLNRVEDPVDMRGFAQDLNELIRAQPIDRPIFLTTEEITLLFRQTIQQQTTPSSPTSNNPQSTGEGGRDAVPDQHLTSNQRVIDKFVQRKLGFFRASGLMHRWTDEEELREMANILSSELEEYDEDAAHRGQALCGAAELSALFRAAVEMKLPSSDTSTTSTGAGDRLAATQASDQVVMLDELESTLQAEPTIDSQPPLELHELLRGPLPQSRESPILTQCFKCGLRSEDKYPEFLFDGTYLLRQRGCGSCASPSSMGPPPVRGFLPVERIRSISVTHLAKLALDVSEDKAEVPAWSSQFPAKSGHSAELPAARGLRRSMAELVPAVVGPNKIRKSISGYRTALKPEAPWAFEDMARLTIPEESDLDQYDPIMLERESKDGSRFGCIRAYIVRAGKFLATEKAIPYRRWRKLPLRGSRSSETALSDYLTEIRRTSNPLPERVELARRTIRLFEASFMPVPRALKTFAKKNESMVWEDLPVEGSA